MAWGSTYHSSISMKPIVSWLRDREDTRDVIEVRNIHEGLLPALTARATAARYDSATMVLFLQRYVGAGARIVTADLKKRNVKLSKLFRAHSCWVKTRAKAINAGGRLIF